MNDLLSKCRTQVSKRQMRKACFEEDAGGGGDCQRLTSSPASQEREDSARTSGLSLSDIWAEPQLRLQLRGVGEGRGKEARMAPLSSEYSRLSARPWERPSCQLWPLQPPPRAGLDRRVTEPEQVTLNFFRDSPVPKKTRCSGPPWLLLGSFPTSLLLSHPRSSKQSGERVGPVPPAARTCSDPEGSWDSVLSTLSTHPSSPISSSPLTLP